MVVVNVCCDINVYDIFFFEWMCVRNIVINYFVYGDVIRFRKVVIVERRRIFVVRGDVVVVDVIEFVGNDVWVNCVNDCV